MAENRVLEGRRIVVGVSGGIAAYKVGMLVSRLVQDGAQVRVMMTPNGERFVGQVTFRSLTGRPVVVDQWTDIHEIGAHISLAQFAELIVIAPATANTLSKVAHGLCDNLLTTTVVAARGPVLLVPAMNDRMWSNPIVQANVTRLRELGYEFVMPEEGRLACGELGPGRMAEPETIRETILRILGVQETGPLAGKRVIITSGPTREWIDPVRFITNPSSGKMGAALAQAAASRGAEVLLISGPGAVLPAANVDTIAVESAEEMLQAVETRLPGTHVFIGAAAVADYRPEEYTAQKRKKSTEPLELRLQPTRDIIQVVAGSKDRPAVVVGFAAETDNLESAALAKLERKDLDLIVANDLTRPDAGFGVDTNEVLILGRQGQRQAVASGPKIEIAGVVLDHVAQLLEEKVEKRKPG